ncbi:hypothetical protein AB6A40_008464 [Gnathostoma spinigerum]|uniref:DFDF domain-containing protein n=1 Tax=Gnathostoma spinigerum TaxID=75299 RepID=A0ABD6EP56_9BILA
MTNPFIGSIIAVDCGEDGYIQGRLVSTNNQENTILIERPFKNGLPMSKKELKISTSKAREIKVVKRAQFECAGSEHCMDTASSSSEAVYKPMKLKNFNESTSSTRGNKKVPKSPLKANRLPKPPYHTSPSSSTQSSSLSPPEENLCDRREMNDVISSHPQSTPSRRNHSEPISPSRNYFRRNGRGGPSGIPQLDAVNGFKIKGNDKYLNTPLDRELLEKDFDFEANLALFDKDSIEDDTFEISESQDNYKNYENVTCDPTRIISWTGSTRPPKAYTAATLMNTKDGFQLPFLSGTDKEEYLKAAEVSIGSAVFNTTVADRLLMFVWNVIDRFEVMVEQMVVLGKQENLCLVSRFLQHISNRACQTIFYGCSLPVSYPFVRVVNDVNRLPLENVQLVVALDGSDSATKITSWLKKLPESTHFVTLENERNIRPNEHTLMIGTGTAGKNVDSNGGSSCEPAGDVGVADVGIPFAWMDEDSANALATSFATQSIVVL